MLEDILSFLWSLIGGTIFFVECTYDCLFYSYFLAAGFVCVVLYKNKHLIWNN